MKSHYLVDHIMACGLCGVPFSMYSPLGCIGGDGDEVDTLLPMRSARETGWHIILHPVVEVDVHIIPKHV